MIYLHTPFDNTMADDGFDEFDIYGGLDVDIPGEPGPPHRSTKPACQTCSRSQARALLQVVHARTASAFLMLNTKRKS